MSPEPPPPPAVIVELCGLPGAGKTSLSRAIGGGRAGFAVTRPNRTVAPDIPDVPRIARKLGLVAEEALRRGAFELEMAHLIGRSRQPGLGGAAARWVQWASTQALMRRARDVPGVHLFDEGVLQALWSLALRGDPAATLRALGGSVGRWSSPDLVIVVDPPVELVARRLSDRRSTHSRLQPSTDDAELRAELVRGRAIFDRLLSGGDDPAERSPDRSSRWEPR